MKIAQPHVVLHPSAERERRGRAGTGRLKRSFGIAALLWVLSACGREPSQVPSLDREAQRKVIERVGDVLREQYVFPEMGARLDSTLREAEIHGEFARARSPHSLAETLSDHVREISGDGHLWVEFNPGPYPEPDREPDQAEKEERRRRLARTNFGLDEAQVLPGNVGYLNVRQFIEPALAGDAAAEAMTALVHTDAVIVDLRESGGGSPDMVVLLASYLLGPEPTHLFDIYVRANDRTDAYHTLRDLPGPRLEDQPIFLLTGASTFSAGEGLAYLLKHLDRATVVGEGTAGGAHPGRSYRVSPEFTVFVAGARVTAPVTGDNWEGRGVRPHVEVPAELALEAALRLALKQEP